MKTALSMPQANSFISASCQSALITRSVWPGQACSWYMLDFKCSELIYIFGGILLLWFQGCAICRSTCNKMSTWNSEGRKFIHCRAVPFHKVPFEKRAPLLQRNLLCENKLPQSRTQATHSPIGTSPRCWTNLMRWVFTNGLLNVLRFARLEKMMCCWNIVIKDKKLAATQWNVQISNQPTVKAHMPHNWQWIKPCRNILWV